MKFSFEEKLFDEFLKRGFTKSLLWIAITDYKVNCNETHSFHLDLRQRAISDMLENACLNRVKLVNTYQKSLTKL